MLWCKLIYMYFPKKNPLQTIFLIYLIYLNENNISRILSFFFKLFESFMYI